MAVGLAMMVLGLREHDLEAVEARPDDALVKVGDVTLGVEDVVRHLPARAAGKAPSPKELGALLEKVVLEEIIYQQAVDRGMVRQDLVVRRRIIQEVRAMVAGEVQASEPSEAVIEAWFNDHRDAFRGPPRYAVSQIFLPYQRGVDRTPEVVALHRRLLDGEPFDALASEVSVAAPTDLSEELSEIARIGQAYGPGFTRAVRATAPGATSPPVRTAHGHHLLRVDRREPGLVPAFEEVRDSVKGRYLRRASRDALDSYLRRVREEADVWLAPDAIERLGAALEAVP